MARTQRIVSVAIGLVVAVAAAVGFQLHRHEARRPFWAAVSLAKSGDYVAARGALLPFARNGDPIARQLLGSIYAEGGTIARDDTRAGMWFRRAECGCDSPGEIEYYTGLDILKRIPPDSSAALRWITRAAEAGNLEAQSLLADPAALQAKGLTVAPGTAEYWQEIKESD